MHKQFFIALMSAPGLAWNMGYADTNSLMVAAEFSPSNGGWVTPAEPIPGMDGPTIGDQIHMILSSGGKTSWALGYSKGIHSLGVNTGPSANWQVVPFPGGFGTVENGFFPAHPETGTPANGWDINGQSVLYFNGTVFVEPADTTTFSNYKALYLYSSEGVGWALMRGTGGSVNTSVFDTNNQNTNGWSPVVNLGLTSIVPTLNPEQPYTLAVTQNSFDILGMKNNNLELLSVDNTNAVHVLNSNFNIPQSAEANVAGMVFAQNQKILVLLFAPITTAESQVYSFVSTDGGKTWINNSNTLPSPDVSDWTLITIAGQNGVISIPADEFINLNQSSIPSWQVYPLSGPSQSDDMLGRLSSDGSQQCGIANGSASTVVCFNFNTKQWLTTIVPNDAVNLNTIDPLGNNQITAQDQNGSMLYYNGQDWHSQPITNLDSQSFTPIMSMSTLPYAQSPQSLWLYGFSPHNDDR